MAKRTSKKQSVYTTASISNTYRVLFKNCKIFFPLWLVGMVASVLTIDLSSEVSVVFGALIFLLMWLTTIYILRHLLAGRKIKLRDALYSSMAPMISTILVMMVAAVQCVPIIVLIIAGAAAVETNLLATFGWGLMFIIFAIGMVLLTIYLLSSTTIALVAVSAPGLYPMAALRMANEVMRGRRGGLILRLLLLIIMLGFITAVIMLPCLWLYKVAPIAAVLMGEAVSCFASIFVAAYLYLYYKWLLDQGDKNGKK